MMACHKSFPLYLPQVALLMCTAKCIVPCYYILYTSLNSVYIALSSAAPPVVSSLSHDNSTQEDHTHSDSNTAISQTTEVSKEPTTDNQRWVAINSKLNISYPF